MNFDPTEEQLLLRNLIERYATDHYDPVKRLRYQKSNRGFHEEGWAVFAELGILAFPFGEELGGFGGSLVDLITVMNAVGKAAITEPLLPHILMAGKLLARGASADLKSNELEPLLQGKKFASLAHCESEARYNLEHISTTVTGKHLNGRKTMVMGAPYADTFLVSARDQSGSFQVFSVNANAEGLEVRPYRLVDGSVAGDITLTDVAGEPLDLTFENFETVIYEARLAICAELVGLMDLLFYDTLDFLKTRNQFGQPLGRFQALQHRMADHYARLELCRSQLFRAAANPLDQANGRIHLSAAKAYISENALVLAEDAVQLHGGIGTTEELMVGQAFKRVALLSSLFGDSDWDLQQYCIAIAESL